MLRWVKKRKCCSISCCQRRLCHLFTFRSNKLMCSWKAKTQINQCVFLTEVICLFVSGITERLTRVCGVKKHPLKSASDDFWLTARSIGCTTNIENSLYLEKQWTMSTFMLQIHRRRLSWPSVIISLLLSDKSFITRFRNKNHALNMSHFSISSTWAHLICSLPLLLSFQITFIHKRVVSVSEIMNNFYHKS